MKPPVRKPAILIAMVVCKSSAHRSSKFTWLPIYLALLPLLGRTRAPPIAYTPSSRLSRQYHAQSKSQVTFGRIVSIKNGCTPNKLYGPNMVSFGPKYAPRGNKGLNVFRVPPLGCCPPLATNADTASLGEKRSGKVNPVSVETVQALIIVLCEGAELIDHLPVIVEAGLEWRAGLMIEQARDYAVPNLAAAALLITRARRIESEVIEIRLSFLIDQAQRHRAVRSPECLLRSRAVVESSCVLFCRLHTEDVEAGRFGFRDYSRP